MLSTHSAIASNEHIRAFAEMPNLDYVPNRTDVVISLTTVPTRLATLKAVLHSLMAQSVRGVPIELHIPRVARSTGEEWTHTPDWLIAAKCIRIIQHADDIGPAMKFLPALTANPSRLVIVADDDVLYPPDLAHRLMEADRFYNGAAAICMRGWRIHRDLSWDRSVLSSPCASGHTHVGVICGHGGYCVRPFHTDLAALSSFLGAPEEAWMMDDVWLSGHLSRARTPKRLIEGTVRLKLPIEPALGGERGRRNDVALAWFRNDWVSTDLER